MPQMAPMSWLTLFLFFTTMLIMFNMMNYYMFTPKISSQKMNKNQEIKSNNWKW